MNNLVDQKQRDQIMFELNENFLVEAGAGSGKTFSLVQRMANIITTGTYEIGEIVAITFTKKAADELKERFQSELELRRKTETDNLVKKRIEKALVDFDQCYLGTVHSFCARMLRERPVEAGLDFDFKELEEKEDRMLVDEAWERYINEMRLHSPELLEKLIEVGVDVAGLRSNLHQLREYADVVWEYKKVDRPNLDEAFSQLVAFIEYVKTSLPDREPEKGYDDLQKKVRRTMRQLRYFDLTSDKTKAEMLRPYEKITKVVLKNWKDKDVAKEIRDEQQHILVEYVVPVMRQWKEYCHSLLIPFLQPALNRYQQLKIERSLLNFQDLLTETAKLLKENSEVRDYFQSKYRCLLVDEFQDTDPIQAEIMMYLTGSDPTEINWTKAIPRQGSLFVVGDPKQSIYRFRRADIDIYQRVKEIIATTGGEALNLTMNFRTTNLITERLNEVFVKHLPDEETKYQAAFRPLHSVKQANSTDEPGQGIFIQNVTSGKKADVIDEDATEIAKYILKSFETGMAEPRDYMILTRYTGDMNQYAAVLQEFGIPVIATSEVKLEKEEEIKALLYLLKWLVEPMNALYAVSVLRGPFFGISDQLLFEFSRAGGKFSLFTDIPDELSKNDRELLNQIFSKVKQYYQWRKQNLPSATIEKVIADLGMLPFYIDIQKGKRDYIRLFQILEKLRAFEASGNGEFHVVVERLEQLLTEETLEDMTLPEEENAVRIMNVHKSKGLEAPIVFLAHPKKVVDPKKLIGKHIKREQEQSYGYFCFSSEKGTEMIGQPENWEAFAEEEYKYLLAEEIRLLYVAATRAEKMLIISKMDKGNEKNNPWHLLLEGLNELPELPKSDEPLTKPAKTLQTINLEEWNEMKEQSESWASQLTHPTFTLERPSEHTEEEFNALGIKREAGGGKEWGSLIHEAFEIAVKDKVVGESTLEMLLFQYQMPMERKEALKQAIDQWQQTAIWNRCMQAEAYYPEFPFTTTKRAIVETDTKEEVIQTGIIDLIFKEADGWVIVDYKTDRLIHEEDVWKLKEFYAKQIETYRTIWEAATKERVKEAYLYFVQTNTFITV